MRTTLAATLALAIPALSQEADLTLRASAGGTLLQARGLVPFSSVQVDLTQTQGAWDAPLLRGAILTGRADAAGCAGWALPISPAQLGPTGLWASLQGPSASSSGTTWVKAGVHGSKGFSDLALFTDAPARLPAGAASLGGAGVSAGDIDGDGRDDLLLSTGAGLLLWRQSSLGTFSDETAARLPALGYPVWWAELLDLDGDGRPELFASGGDPASGNPDVILWNDGAGFFSGGTELPLGAVRTSGVAAGDVDGDGDTDLVTVVGLAGHGTEGGADQLYLSDGLQGFAPDPVFASASWNESVTASTSVVVADLDGDGHLDAFIAKADPGASSGSYGAQNLLLIGDGSGGFAEVGGVDLLPVRRKDQSYDVEVIDLEGDGDLDLVLANGLTSVPGSSSADLLVNQGGAQGGAEGVFVDSVGSLPEAPPINEAIRLEVGVADFDLDGLADVVFGVHDLPPGDGGMPLFLGTSSSPATFARLDEFQTGTFIVGGLVTLDVDGDGDLDLFITAGGSAGGGTDALRARLFVNNTF